MGAKSKGDNDGALPQSGHLSFQAQKPASFRLRTLEAMHCLPMQSELPTNKNFYLSGLPSE